MRRVALALALALIGVIPLENAVFIEGLGRLSKLVGLVAGGFWGIQALMSGRIRQPRPAHLLILLYILWNVASVLWSIDLEASQARALTYVQILGLAAIVWDCLETEWALRAGLQAYLVGACVPIASAIHNYLTAGTTFYYARYSASGFHVDDLGHIVALGIPISWFLALSDAGQGRRGRWIRWANWAYTPPAVLVVFLTASRSSILALGPSLLFALLLLPRLSVRVRTAVVVLSTAALLAIVPLVPESSVERFLRTKDVVTVGGLNGRLEIWREGLDIFAQHPVAGVGTGGFRRANVDIGKAGHNLAISLLAEVGLVGFVLFAAAFLWILRDALVQPPVWRSLWLTLLMIWGLGALTHNWEARKQTWLLLILVTVGAGLVGRREGGERGL